MNHSMKLFAATALLLSLLYSGCGKSDNNPVDSGALYPLTVQIQDPTGRSQGGVQVALKSGAGTTGITDTAGRATIQSPSGAQTVVARIGSILQTEFNVTVSANTSGTVAPPARLAQNSSLRVLVILASAENIENVLVQNGFTTFDRIGIDSLRRSVTRDSTAALSFLRQYTLVFCNCDGGSESGFPVTARTLGRYVTAGGKLYGGHYNYENLQIIYPTNYRVSDSRRPVWSNSTTIDSLQITDSTFARSVGFSVVRWVASDSRGLTGYQKYSDIPTVARVFGIARGLSPQPPVIIENILGTGKYVWTTYHNQDVLSETGFTGDPRLLGIVRYFLYSL
jgi:hypothetical protein